MSKITFTELTYKDVINIKNGQKIGFVSDCEIDTECGKLISVTVVSKCINIFFKQEKTVILWDKICKIGPDVILVDCENICCSESSCKRRIL